MKKATITIITSAALAFAIPLYAANESGMKTDSQPKTGITQQDTKTDSQQRPDVTQSMNSDSEKKGGLAQQQTDKMRSGQIITADKLQGMEVVSQQGEGIGEIKKVMIDKQSGEVQFVTFSKGEILGMGGEEIAAPLSAFTFADDKARLSVDQSKLDNVPQQKAEVTNNDYLRDLETHYGVAPAWEKGNLGDPNQAQPLDLNPSKAGKVDSQSNDSAEINSQKPAPKKVDTQN